MTEAWTQTSFDLPLTPVEEEIWLRQEQRPERVLKRLAVWRLRPDVDLARLLKALRETIAGLPDLNARYRFDDQAGELRKMGAAEWLSCIEIHHVGARAAMTDLLLARQAAVFGADEQPPFTALIVVAGGAAFLSLLLHDLARVSYREDQILAVLIDAYAGLPVKAPTRGRGVPLRPEDERTPPLPSIRRGAGEDLAVRASTGDDDEAPAGALAHRWSVSIALDRIRASPDRGTPTDALVSRVCARFANFVLAAGPHAELTLRILSGDAVFDLPVRQGGPDVDIARAVLGILRGPSREGDPVQPARSERNAPLIQVRIGCGPDLAERKTLLIAEQLAMPTREACIDLELALEFDDRTGLRLTLTTGQAVSPHAGRHLVSRFASSLIDEASGGDAEGKAGTDPAALILTEFRRVLDNPTMGADDDFFDFGGHSLLATRIIGRLRSDHGLELSFADFFIHPTAAELAARAVRVASPNGDRNRGDGEARPSPLAWAQASLWRAYAAHGFGPIFNLPFAIEFFDPVDEAVLKDAVHDLVERHPSLRTRFYEHDGAVTQEIVPMAALPDHAWFWPASDSEGVALSDEARHRFDLARELPLRVRLLCDARTGRRILSLLVHHMVIDEWSLNVMMRDLGVAYRARQTGLAPAWDAPAPSFLAFAQHQSAHDFDRDHLAYWTDRLRGDVAALALPEPDGAALSEAGAPTTGAGWLKRRLEPNLMEGLYAIARRNKVSLFNLVYAAIAATLCRLGGRREIVIGTSASGRNDPRYFETVGYFTTMVAHRIRVDADASLAAFAEYVRDTINASMPYADIPIEHVQQALGRSPADGLIFDVYVQIHANNALNGSIMAADGRLIRYRQIDSDKTDSMFKLQFEIMEDVSESDRSIRLIVTYKSPDYTKAQIEHACNCIHDMLSALADPSLADRPTGQALRR